MVTQGPVFYPKDREVPTWVGQEDMAQCVGREALWLQWVSGPESGTRCGRERCCWLGLRW